MKNIKHQLLYLLLLAVITSTYSYQNPKCPVGSAYSSLYHGHLTVSSGSMVSIQVGVDSMCYEHPLPSPFQQRPGVAMGVSRFEANPSQ